MQWFILLFLFFIYIGLGMKIASFILYNASDNKPLVKDDTSFVLIGAIVWPLLIALVFLFKIPDFFPKNFFHKLLKLIGGNKYYE